MWEQAKITEDSIEPSGDCSVEKNIKAMDAYSKALQVGDMKRCLPFLVSLYSSCILPHPGPILHLQWHQRNSSAKS